MKRLNILAPLGAAWLFACDVSPEAPAAVTRSRDTADLTTESSGALDTLDFSSDDPAPSTAGEALFETPPEDGQTPALSGPAFGCPTRLTGRAFDPSGRLPLYNAVVYVPSAGLDPIAEGAACQTCDANFSGRPVAVALSDAAGRFSLELDEVPRVENLPVVMQIGKWRRRTSIPITACADNAVEDGVVRLPRDRDEGSLPRVAVVRGGSDALECLFKKIGVSLDEMTTPTEDGRIHLYASDDGSAEPETRRFDDGREIPRPGELFASLDRMMSYDVVFMACEGGGRGVYEKYGPAEFSNVQTYADQGGRIFGSHYHNYWIRPDKFDAPLEPYPEVVNFASSQHGFGDDVTADVNDTFPKGAALRDWLVNVGASTEPGRLVIRDGEHTVDSVIPGSAEPFITVDDPNGHQDVVQYFSFTTPVGQEECGRMVFSDLHVASGTGDSGKVTFPAGCVSEELSPQEKALAFMLFDLSSCVQPETAEPVVPTIIR